MRQEPVQADKFAFKNLEPLVYLKTFNQMLEEHKKHMQSNPTPKSELKLVQFSKFPLPQSYYKMQGIFENTSNKLPSPLSKKALKVERDEQLFMRNHRQFMRKVLKGIIKDGEELQASLEKKKKIYQNGEIYARGLSSQRGSESKVRKNKNKIIEAQVSEREKKEQPVQEKEREVGMSRLEKQLSEKKQLNEPDSEGAMIQDNDSIAQILPALESREKKEKFKVKSIKQLNKLIAEREADKGFSTYRQAKYGSQGVIPTFKVSKSNDLVLKIMERRRQENPQEFTKSDFAKSIIRLQYKQFQKQKKFDKQVEDNIQAFQGRLSNQIDAIKSYKY